MAHKFIGIAQTFGVEHIGVVNHNGIIEVAAEAQIVRPHQLHFLHKAESAGAGDFFHIRFAGKIDFKCGIAAVEHRMVEFDGEGDFKAVIRRKTHPFAGFFHFNRFQNFQKTLLRLLIDNAGILQQIDKRQARAVHNRDFGRIQFNQRIIHAISGQCRHNMLDGAHAHAGFGYDGG